MAIPMAGGQQSGVDQRAGPGLPTPPRATLPRHHQVALGTKENDMITTIGLLAAEAAGGFLVAGTAT